MFGSAARTQLASAHFQDWGAHPHIRGAYSYPGQPGSSAARRLLCAPAALGSPRLALAGEFLCADHCMTVHAAMESGERAAAQIARALGREVEYHRPGDLLLSPAVVAPPAGKDASAAMTPSAGHGPVSKL